MFFGLKVVLKAGNLRVRPINDDKSVTMDKSCIHYQKFKSLVDLKLLPIITLKSYCNLNKMTTTRDINTAVIKISGRQGMLCQRVAFLALRIVCTQDKLEEETLSQELKLAIALMEMSHEALIQGDTEMQLPGQHSAAVQALYFEEPLALDRQIRDYIAQVRTFVDLAIQEHPTELTFLNPQLQAILNAETNLNKALEALVNQYQKEQEAAVLEIDRQQVELNYKSCAASATAYVYAQQLEQTLQNLQFTQAQLIQTEKLSTIGQMVAGVAHEINNPVSFIYGNLRYASDYVQDLLDLLNLYQKYYPEPGLSIQAKIKAIDLTFLLQDLPKVLASMEVGADRVRQIVLSLRNFSRSDQILLQAVDLHEGIDSTLLILQNRLKGRCGRSAIEVVKDYGNLPTFECYPGQLNQVFMNLLSNAIDAMDGIADHLRRITIRTSVNADYSGIIIQIADNGSGMPPEIKEQLFTPFFTTKPPGKGTGLGLSISRQIVVETHQGSLKCESELGQGTQFAIEIPRQKSAQEGLRQAPVTRLTADCLLPSESNETTEIAIRQ